MRSVIENVADRLVSLVVPKATAGACPCGDCWDGFCGGGGCPTGFYQRFCSSCDCSRHWPVTICLSGC